MSWKKETRAYSHLQIWLRCNYWYHMRCVGVTPAEVHEDPDFQYICPPCSFLYDPLTWYLLTATDCRSYLGFVKVRMVFQLTSLPDIKALPIQVFRFPLLLKRTKLERRNVLVLTALMKKFTELIRLWVRNALALNNRRNICILSSGQGKRPFA